MDQMTQQSHPGEDLLIEHALHGSHPELQEHIDQCETCAECVHDMRSVKNGIVSLADEDVPAALQERILTLSKRRAPAGIVYRLLEDWYRNPFLIGIGAALLSVFLYFFFMFMT